MHPENNTQMSVEKGILTIKIDLVDVTTRPSKSGKTYLIATTSGNVSTPGFPDVKIGLNCYIKTPHQQPVTRD